MANTSRWSTRFPLSYHLLTSIAQGMKLPVNVQGSGHRQIPLDDDSFEPKASKFTCLLYPANLAHLPGIIQG
jgi:hypothetical protein